MCNLPRKKLIIRYTNEKGISLVTIIISFLTKLYTNNNETVTFSSERYELLPVISLINP